MCSITDVIVVQRQTINLLKNVQFLLNSNFTKLTLSKIKLNGFIYITNQNNIQSTAGYLSQLRIKIPKHK